MSHGFRQSVQLQWKSLKAVLPRGDVLTIAGTCPLRAATRPSDTSEACPSADQAVRLCLVLSDSSALLVSGRLDEGTLKSGQSGAPLTQFSSDPCSVSSYAVLLSPRLLLGTIGFFGCELRLT